jgi:hypothetical protein
LSAAGIVTTVPPADARPISVDIGFGQLRERASALLLALSMASDRMWRVETDLGFHARTVLPRANRPFRIDPGAAALDLC